MGWVQEGLEKSPLFKNSRELPLGTFPDFYLLKNLTLALLELRTDDEKVWSHAGI